MLREEKQQRKKTKEANKNTKDCTDKPGINLNLLMDRECENRQ